MFPSICQSVCLSDNTYNCLPIFMNLSYLSLSVCLSVYIYLSICQVTIIKLCLSVFLSNVFAQCVCLPLCLSKCLHLFDYLSVNVSFIILSLSVWLSRICLCLFDLYWHFSVFVDLFCYIAFFLCDMYSVISLYCQPEYFHVLLADGQQTASTSISWRRNRKPEW